jgi:hypothetical protein
MQQVWKVMPDDVWWKVCHGHGYINNLLLLLLLACLMRVIADGCVLSGVLTCCCLVDITSQAVRLAVGRTLLAASTHLGSERLLRLRRLQPR